MSASTKATMAGSVIAPPVVSKMKDSDSSTFQNPNFAFLDVPVDKREVFKKFKQSVSLLSPSAKARKQKPEGDWLNTLLGFVWPQLTIVIQNAMDDVVEPAIRSEVPQLKDGFDIYTVMGTKPPILGPIYSFSDDETCDSVSIEMAINWEADMHVRVVASILEVKVDNIKFNGTIVVKLCPMLDEIPLFGALQIFFLEPPDVDFRVRVKYSPLPLTNIIQSVADKAIRDAVVLPNRIMSPIALPYQLPSLRLMHNPEPIGVLKLTVLAMRNLPIADYSLIGAGSSDPFAEVSVGAQNWTSDMISSSLNPVWRKGNSCQYMFYTSHQKVTFKVWDYDLTSGNDLLGEVHDLAVEGLKGEKWFDMAVAPEFDEANRDSKGSAAKQCFLCNEQSWSKQTSKECEEIKPRESMVQENTEGKPQVRLLGQIFHLGDKTTRIADGANSLLEISVTGVRPANASTEPCEGQICAVTFDGETRYTTPSMPNVYGDPMFLANEIDPMVVFRLGQIHSPHNVADILEITPEQVEACLRAGHSALWCHSFFYLTKNPTGDVLFKMGEHEATVPLEKSTFQGWEKSVANLEIGPFIVDISIRLTALSSKQKHKKKTSSPALAR